VRSFDLPVRRPVVAAAFALLLLAVGAYAATQLPVREYPDVDPPIVSVATVYPGASARVVERDVTREIEDNLNGIEGIDRITSTSRAGFSDITVEMRIGQDLDAAAADVRDRVSAVRGELPDEVEEPVIAKAAGDAQAMMWLTLTSDVRDRRALTDVVVRRLSDPLSIVPGVSQVIIGGERRYAMRLWLDAEAMAARGLTVTDVARVLRAENVELPAGRIETNRSEIAVRTLTKLRDAEEFRDLVVAEREGAQVTVRDIARVERGAESYRSAVLKDGEPAVGVGIVRQSQANALAVAERVKAELDRLRPQLPEDVALEISYDQTIFIQGSLREVVKTLAITAVLVIVVIYLFLGSARGALVPAATIPTSLIATFAVLAAFGFSINTLTLLALVLAIGLVVDDAIVVLENVTRRREFGEPPLLAGARGGAEVGLAVVATTTVLAAVLVPVAALGGTTGRLFTEFAIALAAAVIFSTFLAMTLGIALAARLAETTTAGGGVLGRVHAGIERLNHAYGRIVERLVGAAWVAVPLVIATAAAGWWLVQNLPAELAPTEDRAVFIVPLTTPKSASIERTRDAVAAVDAIARQYAGDDGPVDSVIAIAGTGRRGPPQVQSGLVIVKLKVWGEREIGQQELVGRLAPAITTIPGARAAPISPPSLVADAFGKPVQLVIGGPDYATAEDWARAILPEVRELPLRNVELEFDRESPEYQLTIDRRLAADLGLSVREIARALRVFVAGDDVTEYHDRGQTYEVVLRGREGDRDTPADLDAIFVRSAAGELVPLAQVVTGEVVGTADSYRRVDRRPSMVISAVPAEGADLGSIVARLGAIARAGLPAEAWISWLGVSEEFATASARTGLVFALALVVVYLVLAALFESFVYPLVVMVTVPLALTTGLAALWATGQSFNVFSQIGLLLVVGLLAKNGILVIDFANQRRAAGVERRDAIVEAARARFRPVLMTSIATFTGALPLALAVGPGSESRMVIGTVVMAGIVGATAITLLLVPGLYAVAARVGGVPGAPTRRLEAERAAAE
jgi:multidrug efflux pump